MSENKIAKILSLRSIIDPLSGYDDVRQVYCHRKVSSSVAYGKKCVHDISGPDSYLGNTRSASKISQILSI